MPSRLGQHFLKNNTAITTSLEALELTAGDKIIEIGPGKGALTLPLLEMCKAKNCQLTVIERDPVLAQNFKQYESDSFRVLTEDALAVLSHIANLTKGEYKIIGNIPYYITGHLMRTISELKHKPVITVLMIQKEVALRISATKPEMNLLAAATQFWAEPKILMHLKASDFDPAPKVDSSIIKLTTKPAIEAISAKAYYSLIRAIFKQPRKTLLNNLGGAPIKLEKAEIAGIISKIGLKSSVRPQDLTLEKLLELCGYFSTN
jgi:16S rRNA (adenine1518-N6/adenine1519-N6)-dimethyltransferase